MTTIFGLALGSSKSIEHVLKIIDSDYIYHYIPYMSNHQGCWLPGYTYIYIYIMYMNVYDLSPINRKFTGLHRFYRKVSSLPRTLGDASSNDVPVGHRHLQGQHDPKEAWHLRQPINGNKTGEQPLLKKFPAKFNFYCNKLHIYIHLLLFTWRVLLGSSLLFLGSFGIWIW